MNNLSGLMRPARFLALVAALFAAITAAPVLAEPNASDWGGTGEQTQVRLVSAVSATGALDTLRLGLHFRMDPDWKIYWRSPGPTGYPPEVDWSKSTGIGEVDFAWPAPERFKIFGMEAIGYKKEVVFPLGVALVRPGEPVSLRAHVSYLVCKEICIPGDADLALDIPAGPADATSFAAMIDRFRARVPIAAHLAGVSMEQVVFRKLDGDAVSLRVAIRSDRRLLEPDLFAEGPPLAFFEAPQVQLSRDGRYAVITELGTGATAEEIAATALLLAGPQGGFYVGATLSPNGGDVMH